MIILIDPGHGYCPDTTGHWEYARSEHYGVREDLLTPLIALKLEEMLVQAGHTVHLTRSLPGTDEGDEIGSSGEPRWKEAAIFHVRRAWKGHPEYREKGSSMRGRAINARPLLANLVNADLAVSLHINASSRNPNAHGVSVHHRHQDAASIRLSQEIYNKLVEANPAFDGGRGIKDNGDRKLAWFRRMDDLTPSALVEFLFFTNKDDAAMLRDQEQLDLAAESIFLGIESFIEKGE